MPYSSIVFPYELIPFSLHFSCCPPAWAAILAALYALPGGQSQGHHTVHLHFPNPLYPFQICQLLCPALPCAPAQAPNVFNKVTITSNVGALLLFVLVLTWSICNRLVVFT